MRHEYFNPWVIFDKRDGREICQTPLLRDAQMMVAFDPDHRDMRKRKIILDQIVDVTSQELEPDLALREQPILPDRQQQPFSP